MLLQGPRGAGDPQDLAEMCPLSNWVRPSPLPSLPPPITHSWEKESLFCRGTKSNLGLSDASKDRAEALKRGRMSEILPSRGAAQEKDVEARTCADFLRKQWGKTAHHRVW